MSRRVTQCLLAALLCALGVAAVGILALAVPAGHERDGAILHGFVQLGSSSRNWIIKGVAHLADPASYVVLGALLAAVAFVRGRRWRGVAVLVLLLATGLTTQLLKVATEQPRLLDWLNEPSASWPSGHATAAMTLALCAVLVAPRSLRWLAVLVGGGFAIAVGYAILVLHWHYPSDVLAGYLVAGMWTALAAAALAFVERPESAEARSQPAPRMWPALAGALGAAVVGIVAARVGDVSPALLDRPSLLVGAVAIAALALALPASASRV